MWVRARAASSKGTVSSVPAWFRADSGTNIIKQGEIVTGRPCSSVAQWSECSHGVREVLVRVPVGPCAFSSPVTFGGSVWVGARAASSKGTVSSVPAWFRADSGTNLIKQGKIVTGRPCGSVAQWSECSHGVREVLGPGRAMCFFLPCDIYIRRNYNWAESSDFGTYRLCEQRRFRRACASAQSRQNLRCSLIQAVSQEDPSDRKPDPWPL